MKQYMFTIPLDSQELVDANAVCDAPLYVIAHAEVNYDTNGDGVIDDQDEGGDTAFGGDQAHAHNIGANGAWWYDGLYYICCGGGEPPVTICETGFAYGTHVFTTGKRSNPDKLGSLGLTRNRWGWAINLSDEAPWTSTIYAGAGLNRTSKGTDAGELTASWDGSVVTVTYTMAPGFTMSEVHVYAADADPETIAPGQYGHGADFETYTNSYSATFEVTDTDGDGLIWVIAHAVVCSGE